VDDPAVIGDEHHGGEAQIAISWSGLAPEIPDLSGTRFEALSNMPFPHAQHIHAGGEGRCPTPAEDSNGDGVVNTPEGAPAYGPVVTSLTTEGGDTTPAGVLNVEEFPTGGSAEYARTIDLDFAAETDAGTFNPAELVRAENAVIVIHGLNPAIMPGETALSDSAISDDLPLAATAPALCGVLTASGDGSFTAQLSPPNVVASQVGQMPAPGVSAGGGSTALPTLPTWLIALTALGLAVASAGLTLVGRRSS
jgi:hypothetical protein